MRLKSGGTCGCERDARGPQRAWESRALHGAGHSQRQGEAGKDNIGEITLFQAIENNTRMTQHDATPLAINWSLVLCLKKKN